jgi:hypothetical protein
MTKSTRRNKKINQGKKEKTKETSKMNKEMN